MLHNALTSYPKLLAAFRRALGETSTDFTGIERAGETVTPTLDLWALPEWAILRGEIIYSRTVGVAAAAGLDGSVELVNPTGSGILAVVLEILNTQTTVLEAGVDTGTALGVVATTRGVANDARWPNLGAVSACTLVTGQLAAGVALPQDYIVQNARTTRPYILQPGKKLTVISFTPNAVVGASLLWTERPLLAGESGV